MNKASKLFSFFVAEFSRRNSKHVLRVYIELKRRGSSGELENAVETLASWLVFPQHCLFSQTSIRVPETR